jgi:hypothetical protein
MRDGVMSNARIAQGNRDIMVLDNGKAAQTLYDEIRQAANHFLHNCSCFPVEILALRNPTYEQIAMALDSLVKVITALADDHDPMMGQKAFEYCLLMKKMGVAINNKDQSALLSLVDEMKRKPGS